MERKKRSPHVNVDRISSLPEPILHHILSFLRFERVVQTSVLSKTWKRIWHTYPTIYFGRFFATLSRQKTVLKGLEKTLLNRHMDAISLEELLFSLRLSDDPKVASNINRCLIYAIASNVRKLHLYFDGYYHMKYCLPQIVYYAKSIVVLDLVYCKLGSPSSNVTLSSLRELALFKCTANDEVIRDIVVGCPLIECLKIIYCQGLKSLEFLNLGKLKKFMVQNEDGLERVSIEGVNVHSVDISSLHTPSDINVAPCKNLKRLKLCQLSIMDEWLCNHISELPVLEYLEIFGCMNIRSIKISSRNLKQLLVRVCNTLGEFKLDTPNLSIFEYEGDMVSFSSNALALSETRLFFDSDNNIDNQWYLKLIALLAKLNHQSNVLKLRCYEAVIIPRELREILCPPLAYENHVCFFVNFEYNTFSLAKIVDGLLWISPHAETLSIKYEHDCDHKFSFQFSYKKPLIYDGETCRCCRSLPLLCWQHCIKEVKIEHSRVISSSAYIDRQSYSSEDGEILEKIDDLWKLLLESDDSNESNYSDESNDNN